MKEKRIVNQNDLWNIIKDYLQSPGQKNNVMQCEINFSLDKDIRIKTKHHKGYLNDELNVDCETTIGKEHVDEIWNKIKELTNLPNGVQEAYIKMNLNSLTIFELKFYPFAK